MMSLQLPIATSASDSQTRGEGESTASDSASNAEGSTLESEGEGAGAIFALLAAGGLAAGVSSGGNGDSGGDTAGLAPIIISNGGRATAAILVDENQTAVTDVQSIDISDSEGNGLTYTLTGGADSALFNIDASSGELTFINAPNFESPSMRATTMSTMSRSPSPTAMAQPTHKALQSQ